jgi:ComF family protein
VAYQYPWRHLIQDFKFHGASGWALHFGRMMQHTPGISDLLAQTDWLIPMPLADDRLKERGYNQSQLLAQALSPHQCHTALLSRTIHNVAQSALSRDARLANVEGVYRVPVNAASLLQGRHVTLLDDVMTSGASLSSATSALLAGGARVVCAVVFARAE